MSDVLASWEDFSGGHWGNLGPVKAQPNQWGGMNAALDEAQTLGPITQPVPLTMSQDINGQLKGMFWAWGSNGQVYYVSTRENTSTSTFLSSTTSDVYRFTFTTSGATCTLTSVTTIPFVPTKPPDFALVADELYLTLYSHKTYRIAVTGNTTTALSGTYGNAPAGRAIALYGERLVVGGVKDARFGNVANRIVFSGNDTGNDPTDRTAWETLNYFDVGPPDAVITGLYPTRDYLTVVMEDQSVWTVTGVLGSSATARRMNGYSKGSGAIEAYQPTHGTVDPSQTKVWMFDHATNGLVRFNGASRTPLPHVGVPRSNRTQTTAAFGDVVSIGGADEFAAFGVSLGASSGASRTTATNPVVLTRIRGSNSAVRLTFPLGLEGGGWFNAGQIVANDRYQIIGCSNVGYNGQGGIQTADDYPNFFYWYASPPEWDAYVNGDTDFPEYGGETSTTTASAYLPYKKSKTPVEWKVDGLLVRVLPSPSAGTAALSAYLVGDAAPSTVGTRSVFTTSTVSVTFGAGSATNWPDVRVVFLPLRFDRVMGVRPVFTLTACRLLSVELLGKQTPWRVA